MNRCPVCKSIEGVRAYIYGMPSQEPNPAKYVLGGCLIFDDMPDFKCLKCSTDFYKNSKRYTNRFISDGSGTTFKCPDCQELFPVLAMTAHHECAIEY
jgi:hypothetical protein